MAKGHLVTRKTREILRLRWSAKLSVRDAAGAVGVSVGVVCKLEKRASEAGPNWKRVEGMEDVELERVLYGVHARGDLDRPEPDLVWVHTELRRPGVTLELLHLEYLQEHPTGSLPRKYSWPLGLSSPTSASTPRIAAPARRFFAGNR